MLSISHSFLKNRYSFQNFICSDTNLTAKQSVLHFTNSQHTESNILIISGEIGSGKTHLAKSAYKSIVHQFPKKPFLGLSYEKLLVEYDTIMKPESLNDLSVLLIDSFFINESAIDDFKRILTIPRKTKIIITCILDYFDDINAIRVNLKNNLNQEEKKMILKLILIDFQFNIQTDLIDNISKLDFANARHLENFIIVLITESKSKGIEINDYMIMEKFYSLFH